MPRFGISSNFSADSESRRAHTPPLEGPVSFVGPLSCLSPDGRSVYSLVTERNGQVFVESHNLPLAGTTDDEIEREFPPVIRTRLPKSVESVLAVEAPIELLCVHGDSMQRPPKDTDEAGPQKCLQPLLCLYTRHDVFRLELAYMCPFVVTDGIVEGEVVSVVNPMDSFLAGSSSSLRIVRVRSAPHRRMGYAFMSPPGAMAMLTHNATVNEYTLVLHHGVGGKLVTTPLQFGLEQIHDECGIVDFCFAQSNGLALLPSASTLFLKASGEVLGASPIVFDGATVSRSVVKEAVEYIDEATESFGDTNAPRWRQMLAARRFLEDVFLSRDDGQSYYLQARMRAGGDVRNAALFPVQIQGPVVLPAPMEPDEAWNRALVIEPFFSRDLVGMAIARAHTGVDFAVVPVTAILPRFGYENQDDGLLLDDSLAELGVVVERVEVSPDGEAENYETSAQLPLATLVRDPVMDNMMHYASSQGVVSVSTNAMRFASSKVHQGEGADEGAGFVSPSSKRANETVRTSAWSSLDVSAGSGNVRLTGAVISGDAHLGHSLVVRLSNGNMAVVNLTESRYLHEKESLSASAKEGKKDSATHTALQAVERTKPLHELLQPMVDRVNAGLSGMGKIVGGATTPSDINAGTLATVLAIKERCEKEVVLPLLEINEVALSGMKNVQEMYKSQVSQLRALQETVHSLKGRMTATVEKLESAETNASLLAQRSSNLLQACQDLQPTLTQSEIDYFRRLKLLKAKCDTWEESFKRLSNASDDVIQSLKSGRVVDMRLSKSDIANCHDLLKGQELMMEQSMENLQKTKGMVGDIAAATGLSVGGGDSEEWLSQGQ